MNSASVILNTLQNARNPRTVAQLQKKAKVKGVTQRISELRDAGYPINSTVVRRNGREVTAYTYGY